MKNGKKNKIIAIVIYIIIAAFVINTQMPGSGIFSVFLLGVLFFVIHRINISERENNFIVNPTIKVEEAEVKPDFDYTKLPKGKLARKFRDQYRKNPEFFEDKLMDSDLLIPDLDIDDQSHFFYGKKVVITGVFEEFPYREEMAKLIKSVGGDNNVSISRLTDYVVVGSNPGPRKMELIKKHNTTVINEDEFIELFQEQLNE